MSQTEAKGSKQEEDEKKRKKEERLEGAVWSLQGVEKETLVVEIKAGKGAGEGFNKTRALHPLCRDV